MPTITIENGGKITLTKELLDHLGISHGERIKVTRLPGELIFRGVPKTQETVGGHGKE